MLAVDFNSWIVLDNETSVGFSYHMYVYIPGWLYVSYIYTCIWEYREINTQL